MTTISEKTKVPLSFVLVLLGGGGWLAKISFAEDQNEKNLSALSSSVKELQTSVMVDLRDQAANISELRTQNMVIDARIEAFQARFERFVEWSKSQQKTK